jgi:Uma2 family endonuclease
LLKFGNLIGMNKRNLATATRFYTEEEYLAFEREAADKHELIDGEIVSMAGASRKHNLVGTNTTIALGVQLRGKRCEIYANDSVCG